MVTAAVMVKANTSEADRVKSEMAGFDGVGSVNIVAGDVDFVVKVSVDQPAQVKEIVADYVQAIDGVEDTQTYIAMD
jgi:DNA-binding Lrp family transcriptional regulator